MRSQVSPVSLVEKVLSGCRFPGFQHNTGESHDSAALRPGLLTADT